MPKIKASPTFENSGIDQESLFDYIKPDVRQLIFNKETNTEGVYVLFLPGYKQDAYNNGVWYKKFKIRKAFGTDKAKKTYYVKDIDNDPANYFQRAFKARYPEEAKVIKAGSPGNDTSFSIYPPYGFYSDRIVFNVGLLAALREQKPIDKVVHVLDTPIYKGATMLFAWMDTKQPDGTPNPFIADDEAAVAVFISKSSEVGAMGGWRIEPRIDHRYKIPDAYTETQNLYNLDDIFIEMTNEEIISDLRGMFSAAVFDACMDGYAGIDKLISYAKNPLPVSSVPVVSAVTSLLPPPALTPAITPLPAPPAPSPAVAPAVQTSPLPAPVQSLPAAPVAPDDDSVVVGGVRVKKADLRSFLVEKEAKTKKG